MLDILGRNLWVEFQGDNGFVGSWGLVNFVDSELHGMIIAIEEGSQEKLFFVNGDQDDIEDVRIIGGRDMPDASAAVVVTLECAREIKSYIFEMPFSGDDFSTGTLAEMTFDHDINRRSLIRLRNLSSVSGWIGDSVLRMVLK